MLTNAIITMFKNRIKDLKSYISSAENSLKAARNAECDYPSIERSIEDGLTATASATMTLLALEDFVPFLEGITASTSPLASLPIPSVPPHALTTPQVNLCGRPDDSEAES